MVRKVVFGNFKGGTGKTTNSCMIAYHLAEKGYKTLLVDLDPQANATSLFLLTAQNQRKEVISFDETLMTAISREDLSPIVTNIRENLYLLPSFSDFTSYPLFLEKKFPDSIKNRNLYFSQLLKPMEDEYDYILFDLPPTLSIYTDSAILASDAIVIVLQTQERSLVGAEAFIEYIQGIYDEYQTNFDILGILPVLLKNQSIVDESVLNNARKTFGEENLFKTIIRNMERLKRYDITGIIDPDTDEKSDMHDKRVHELYNDVTEEFLYRYTLLEE